jgi:hypothetical protein
VLLRELADACDRLGEGTSYVYFIQAGSGPIKIGVARDAYSRRNDLQIGNHEPLRVVLAVPGDVAVESSLHAAFASLRIRGEWFRNRNPLRAFVRLLTVLHSDDAPPASDLARRFFHRLEAA